MSKTWIPNNYTSALSLYETQTAIGLLKRTFEEKLCLALNLKRVSAPLFVDPNTGLNDDLSGVERPVRFDLKETGKDAVVVHSLAKWKRMALKEYGFPTGEGLYTDMNAIRRDEDELDNKVKTRKGFSEFCHSDISFQRCTRILYTHSMRLSSIHAPFFCRIFALGLKNSLTNTKNGPDWSRSLHTNYLYFLLRAASDFFLRLTLGFS